MEPKRLSETHREYWIQTEVRIANILTAVFLNQHDFTNFIRGRAVNSRLFRAFYDDLGKEHQYLLFHTEVRWLSRGKVLYHVVELVTEVAVFLREHGSVELATLFGDNRFQLKVF